MGCDVQCGQGGAEGLRVSIHAPAWGATLHGDRGALGVLVSIHAPAWGATPSSVSGEMRTILFQSTHPRGVRRPARTDRAGQGQCFNPRTRVGCDSMMPTARQAARSFNPRTRVGCDKSCVPWSGAFPKFQSTHPRGVRPPFRLARALCFTMFQSTHPRGVRHLGGYMAATLDKVSIHAPAWGAT